MVEAPMVSTFLYLNFWQRLDISWVCFSCVCAFFFKSQQRENTVNTCYTQDAKSQADCVQNGDRGADAVPLRAHSRRAERDPLRST